MLEAGSSRRKSLFGRKSCMVWSPDCDNSLNYRPAKRNSQEALLFYFRLRRGKKTVESHRLLWELWSINFSFEYWFRRLKSSDIDTDDKERESQKRLKMQNWWHYLAKPTVSLHPKPRE
ncbi:hypothetical protein TNCT_709381 [Trichonephila clavata]|uniref:Uncharacterized protein n=1 Tax=Trichonephila clavata TaxID=2740835 RepID=A0A8X6LPX4_TRICU|nr:hypothetical protein TNCT_709381 [Trichonephila clavata]